MPGDFRQGGSLGPEKAFGQRNKDVGVPTHFRGGGKGNATQTSSGRQLWSWCCAKVILQRNEQFLIPVGVARPVDDTESYAHY